MTARRREREGGAVSYYLNRFALLIFPLPTAIAAAREPAIGQSNYIILTPKEYRAAEWRKRNVKMLKFLKTRRRRRKRGRMGFGRESKVTLVSLDSERAGCSIRLLRLMVVYLISFFISFSRKRKRTSERRTFDGRSLLSKQ